MLRMTTRRPMRKIRDVFKWEHHQIHHGQPRFAGLCQQASRMAWGLPAWASSAKLAWEMVPEKHRFYTDRHAVPAGALVYDENLSKYGHAWVSAGKGHGWSTDYKRRGHIDRVPLHLPRWRGGNPKVHWTDWTPLGLLGINMSEHGADDRRVF